MVQILRIYHPSPQRMIFRQPRQIRNSLIINKGEIRLLFVAINFLSKRLFLLDCKAKFKKKSQDLVKILRRLVQKTSYLFFTRSWFVKYKPNKIVSFTYFAFLFCQ